MRALYYYKAINSEGRVVRGTVAGPDPGVARESIISSGLYLLKLRRMSPLLIWLGKALTFKRVQNRDVIEFARSIAIMLRAGVPVVQAIREIAASTDKPLFSEALMEIGREIELGSSFSDAFSKKKAVFPDILIRLSKIGEETGRLDKSFEDAAAHLEKMEELYSTMKKALMYPVFAVVFTLAALLFWLIFVLPNVMKLFTGMNLTLPLPTKILLVLSNFCRGYWYLLIILPLVFAVIIAVLRRKKATKYYLDRALLKAPILTHVTCNWLLTFFSEQLRILTESGIPVNRSLLIFHGAVNNEVMKRAIKEAHDEIESGSGIAAALKRQSIFPGLIVRLVAVGESSGSLEKQFAYLSEFYSAKLNDYSEKMGKMLEPVIISLVGIMFALIIMGLLLPVYDLVSKVQ
ncbi:MAG: type II secretion system F family protein [Thermodesulfobacteriota bacterium]